MRDLRKELEQLNAHIVAIEKKDRTPEVNAHLNRLYSRQMWLEIQAETAEKEVRS